MTRVVLVTGAYRGMLVTGAYRGIGQELARQLALRGDAASAHPSPKVLG